MNGEDDVFLKQMKGVSPIKKNNITERDKPKLKKNIIRKKHTTNKTESEIIPTKNFKKPTFNLEELNIKEIEYIKSESDIKIIIKICLFYK